MTTRIALDSIRLDANCFDDSRRSAPANSERRGHHRRQQTTPAQPINQCTGTFRFHFFEEGSTRPELAGTDIPFVRQGINLRIGDNIGDTAVTHVARHQLSERIGSFLRAFTSAAMIRRQVSEYMNDSAQRENAEILYQILSVGEFERPDEMQSAAFNRFVERFYGMPTERRENLFAMVPISLVAYSAELSGDPDLLARLNTVLDIYSIYKHFKVSIPASAPQTIHQQARRVFEALVMHLYMGNPPLNELNQNIQSLALDLYRLPPASGAQRINLYSILGGLLSRPIVEVATFDQATRQVDIIQLTLSSRSPFNRSNDARAIRMQTLGRALSARESELNEDLLRYLGMATPAEATFQSVYDTLATPTARQAIVTRITTNTRIIRPAYLTASWLASGNNLREALEACLFDPAHPERGAITVVRTANGGQALQLNVERLRAGVQTLLTAQAQAAAVANAPVANPDSNPAAFQLNAPRLRGNVTSLLAANFTNRREFLATVLSLMYGIYGNRGQNSSIRAFVDGRMRDIPLRINEPDRENLERFYAETIRDLGAREAVTEILMPISQGIVCAAGVTGVSVLLANGQHNSDEIFSPSLAASGFAVGAGCGPLVHRGFTGAPRNAYVQTATVGGPAGVGAGLLFGFLPSIVRALSSDDPTTPIMMVTPPIPLERQSGSNNVTDFQH